MRPRGPSSILPVLRGGAGAARRPLFVELPVRAVMDDTGPRSAWLRGATHSEPPFLVQDWSDELEFRVRAVRGTRFRGSVRILGHAWRDGGGRVQVHVDAGGRELWTAVLETADVGGRFLDVDFDIDLGIRPTGEATVARLRMTAQEPSPVAEIRWAGLRLAVPVSPRAVRGGPVSAEQQTAETGGHPTAGTGPGASPVASHADEVRPTISVVMPVCDPDPELLRTTVASVLAQTWEHWELCITDDGSVVPGVAEQLDALVAEHPGRVLLHRNPGRTGIAAATNAAVELATGEYVALLDHDDLLHPDALGAVAAEIRASAPELVYTDDEVLFGERVAGTSTKPGWSADMLRELMFTGHLCAYRRQSMLDVGGLRSGLDGSQDYDLALRVVERGGTVSHVPRVLYSWRAHTDSMAGNPHSKPLAYPRALEALEQHLVRSGLGGTIVYGREAGHYRHLPARSADEAVTVVVAVPRADGEALHGLRETLLGLVDPGGPPWSAIVSTANPNAPAVRSVLRDLPAEIRVRLVSQPTAASTAVLLRHGLTAAQTERVLLVRAPAVRLSANLLWILCGHAAEDGVQAVGPRILGAGGRVESAGIAVRAGSPERVLVGAPGADQGVAGVARFTRAVGAVDDVVATTRTALGRVGGLDERLGELALVHHCLLGATEGRRTVLAGDGLVGRPAGSGAPAIGSADLLAFRRHWADRPDDGLTPLGSYEGATSVPWLPGFVRS